MPATPPPAEVYTGELSHEDVDALFEQLRSARVFGVLLRQSGARYATETPRTLEDARLAIEQRTCHVQLRYLYDAQEWWDTIIPTVSGCRLVRIAQPAGPAST